MLTTLGIREKRLCNMPSSWLVFTSLGQTVFGRDGSILKWLCHKEVIMRKVNFYSLYMMNEI